MSSFPDKLQSKLSPLKNVISNSQELRHQLLFSLAGCHVFQRQGGVSPAVQE